MSSNKPGRSEQPSYAAEPSYKKMAVLIDESTQTMTEPQLVELTTNVLYINGPAEPEDQIVIYSHEEAHPLAIKYLASKGIEVTQDIENGTISVKYNASVGSTVTSKEFEQFHMVEIVSEEFDNLFQEIIYLAVQESFKEQEELDGSLNPGIKPQTGGIKPLPHNDALRQPPIIFVDEMYPQEPLEEPGLLTKFTNGCTYYFNSAYNAVFGEPEPALVPAKSIADEVTIMPYPAPGPKPGPKI